MRDSEKNREQLLEEIEQLKSRVVELDKSEIKYKKTEKKLKESEFRYKTLFEKSADPILIYKNRHFVDCNQAAVKILGMEFKEQILNCKASDLSPEFQPDGLRSKDKSVKMDAIASEKGFNKFEWIHKRANGELFPVEVMLTIVQTDEELYFFVLWRDITERKQMEEKLVKLKNELEIKVTEQTKELQEKISKLERFYDATIARELRMKELWNENKKLKEIIAE